MRIPASMACLCDGAKVLEADGSTVAEVLADLRRRHPAVGGRLCDESGTPNPFVKVFAGEDQLQGADAPVGPELTLHVLAGAAGG